MNFIWNSIKNIGFVSENDDLYIERRGVLFELTKMGGIQKGSVTKFFFFYFIPSKVMYPLPYFNDTVNLNIKKK